VEQSAHNYSGVTPLHLAATCWKMPRNDTAVVVWRSSARKNETTATWCLSASIAPGSHQSIGQYRAKCTLCGLKLLHFAEPILHDLALWNSLHTTTVTALHEAATWFNMPRDDTAGVVCTSSAAPVFQEKLSHRRVVFVCYPCTESRMESPK